MLHAERLAAGLQALLCEGSFVDVRICCSDHSASDGLGAHRAVLAAASPGLLAPCMAQEGSETEDMVCLHLPDFSSSAVASVLSLLYYGETWLALGDWRARVAINSLLASLGVNLQVAQSPDGLCLRPSRPPSPCPPVTCPATPSPRRPIKTEPREPQVSQVSLAPAPQILYSRLQPSSMQNNTLHSGPYNTGQGMAGAPVELPVKPSQIKRERMEGRRGPGASFPLVHPPSSSSSHSSSSSSPSSFPLIQTTSLLKCPAPHCTHCSLSIPEIQAHIAQCRPPPDPGPGVQEQEVKLQYSAAQGSEAAVQSEEGVHVDVKPNTLGLKKEQQFKQEAVDPLAKRELEEQGQEQEKVQGQEQEEDVDDIQSVSSSSSSPACCPEVSCHYTTNSPSSLQAHTIMHQRKTILQAAGRSACPVCKEECGSLTGLKRHVEEKHGVRAGSSILCSIQGCGLTIDPAQFYRHILHNHYASQYNLKCDQCDFSTTTTTHLKTHLMQHLDERPYTCSICGQAFRSRPQALEHEAAAHSEVESVECDQCEERFTSRGRLAKHRQSRHSNQSHPCAECDKTFVSKASLRSHERKVHASPAPGDLAELCAECGSAGGGQCQCGGQKRKETVSACPVCGKQVARRNLAGHLHYHRQSALRPYICQQCSATFTHASSLKRHALLHGGVMPFSCTQCNKGFYQRVAWMTHLKSHTTERLPCPGCAKLFLTKYLLNQHLKAKRACREANG